MGNFSTRVRHETRRFSLPSRIETSGYIWETSTGLETTPISARVTVQVSLRARWHTVQSISLIGQQLLRDYEEKQGCPCHAPERSYYRRFIDLPAKSLAPFTLIFFTFTFTFSEH